MEESGKNKKKDELLKSKRKKNIIKKFEDLTEEQKEAFKEITIERLKRMPDNFRLSIG